MDIKITGVTTEILRNALAQARDARLFILGKMREAISAPREEVAAHAPRIISTKIHPDYIGMVIGKGGETIRSLEAEYEVQIDIEEDGTIRIYGTNGELAEAARQRDRLDDQGRSRSATSTPRRGGQAGRLRRLRRAPQGRRRPAARQPHPAPGERLASAEQVLDRGDMVRVTVVEVDKDRGRIGLTLVAKLNEDGGEITPEQLVEVAEANPAPPRSEGDRPRGGGRDRAATADGGETASDPRPAGRR